MHVIYLLHRMYLTHTVFSINKYILPVYGDVQLYTSILQKSKKGRP